MFKDVMIIHDFLLSSDLSSGHKKCELTDWLTYMPRKFSQKSNKIHSLPDLKLPRLAVLTIPSLYLVLMESLLFNHVQNCWRWTMASVSWLIFLCCQIKSQLIMICCWWRAKKEFLGIPNKILFMKVLLFSSLISILAVSPSLRPTITLFIHWI